MKAIYIILILVFTMAVVSCRKDYIGNPPIDPNIPVSFKTDVQPILTTNCAKSGCHVAGGQTPNLAADAAYDNLTGLGYVDPADSANPAQDNLYKILTSSTGYMPKSGKLSSHDINLIYTWIKQGAHNN
jgi:hypothetical protein